MFECCAKLSYWILAIYVSNYVGETTTAMTATTDGQLMSDGCCYRGRMIMNPEKPRRPLCSIDDSDCTLRDFIKKKKIKKSKGAPSGDFEGSSSTTLGEVAGLLFALSADLDHVIPNCQHSHVTRTTKSREINNILFLCDSRSRCHLANT